MYVNSLDSAFAKGSLIVAIALASGLAVVVGIVHHRPERRGIWYLVAGAQLVGAAGTAVWYGEFIRQDAPPTPGGPQDIFFIAFYLVFGAALVGVLRRSEAGNDGLLDAAIFAAGGMLLAYLVLVDPYIASSGIPVLGQTVQIVSLSPTSASWRSRCACS